MINRTTACLATLLAASLLTGAGAAVAAEGAANKDLADYGVLRGRWVRPDGGYQISIRNADADGKLDALYANPYARPNALPFARAEATRDGATITAHFELRAGGYNGSTYTLRYDPADGLLKGVYYQAVAQQKYEVYFVRAQ